MDYLKSLLELIKSKGEISEDNIIILSLEEIVSIWNRGDVVKSYPYKQHHIYTSDTMIEQNQKIKKIIDNTDFLKDVISCLEKLEEDGEIKFLSINNEKKLIKDINYLNSPEDKIYLKFTKTAKRMYGSPKFIENPPQIIWGDIKIPIPHGSRQFCVCRVLFNKKIDEIVSWDEIMEEIIGGEDFKKNDWRTVYDAVCAVNKKVKEKTGKNIFRTSRKSFSRTA